MTRESSAQAHCGCSTCQLSRSNYSLPDVWQYIRKTAEGNLGKPSQTLARQGRGSLLEGIILVQTRLPARMQRRVPIRRVGLQLVWRC